MVVGMDGAFSLLRSLIILLIPVAASACSVSEARIQPRAVEAGVPADPKHPVAVVHEPFNYARVRLGTTVSLRIHAPDRDRAERAAKAAFDRIDVLESILSDYRTESELSRLRLVPAGSPVRVGDELLAAISRGRLLSKRTGGAFDLTVGPLSSLWRESFRRERLPSDDAVADAAARVGWSFVHVDAARSTVLLEKYAAGTGRGGLEPCKVRVLHAAREGSIPAASA